MLRPAMIEMLKPDQDCYSFVVAVAKRARELLPALPKGVTSSYIQ